LELGERTKYELEQGLECSFFLHIDKIYERYALWKGFILKKVKLKQNNPLMGLNRGTVRQSISNWIQAVYDRYWGKLHPIAQTRKHNRLPRVPCPPFPATIDKQAIQNLPLVNYPGPIYLISTYADLKRAVRLLRQESLLGFDTETRPVFRRGEYYPAALLQLTGEQASYLFQLGPIKKLKPLKSLLENPNIIKVGVAVHDDVRKLQELLLFKDAGFKEISYLTQKLGIKHTGLRNLAAILLGVRVSKAAQVSNWAVKQLSDAQIHYAATDAWISRLLYQRAQSLLEKQLHS